MDPFLDRTAFPGPTIDLAASGASFAGQARFNGCIAVTNWLRAEVERLLPPQLALAANASPTPDIHPMIFVFGEQTQGAVIFARLPVPAGPDYGEFALAIPFVRHRDGRHLHVHVPRMYSSYFPATWNGNAHYGFGKAMARMEWRGPVFLMTSETGDLLLHAAVEPAGAWPPCARSSRFPSSGGRRTGGSSARGGGGGSGTRSSVPPPPPCRSTRRWSRGFRCERAPLCRAGRSRCGAWPGSSPGPRPAVPDAFFLGVSRRPRYRRGS